MNVPAVYTDNEGFGLVATPTGGSAHATYVRFTKGIFTKGPDKKIVPQGYRVIAIAATEAWVRLRRGEPPRRIAREEGKPFPIRQELGDLDQEMWPLFDDKPSDPWSLANELLLVDELTGQPLMFSTSSFTGREAVQDLCRKIVYARRVRGLKARPVISLGVGVWSSKRGPVSVPRFEIVGWVDGANAVTEPEPSQLRKDVMDRLADRSVAPVETVKPSEPLPQPRQRKEAAPAPLHEDADLDDELPF